MSAWKPGDVALVYGPDNNWRIGIRALSNDGWFDDVGAHDADIEIQRVRPLVVIDPEDREQVERLVDALADEGAHRGRVPLSDAIDRTQAALRSLLAPPKPDEPMGLGAVVEDADGRKYIRTADTDCVRPWSYANNNTDFEWSQVAAVRVLSEGVAE